MSDQLTTFFTDLLLEKGLVLVILSFMIGQFIKNGTHINNKYIPIIVAIVCSILAAITNKWTVQEESIVMAAIDGFIIGGFTPGLYDMLSQNKKFKELFCAKKEEVIEDEEFEEEIIEDEDLEEEVAE